MTKFEQVLEQYEPMISATLRKLNIYRDHEQFRQASRVALWQAWERYDAEKGHFAPFAARSIRGAMLDLMRRENKFQDYIVQTEDQLLVDYLESEYEMMTSAEWSDELVCELEQLSKTEKQLIQWLFVEGFTQKECAEKAKISIAGIKKRRERLLAKLKNKILDNQNHSFNVRKKYFRE